MSELNDDDPMRFSDEEAEWRGRQGQHSAANGHDPDPTPRFKPVRFRDIKLSTNRPYLVKGIIPREGLTVVWGPPKCGKSFWVFDLGMHIALDWEYRGRRVSAGAVVYIACEGERGLASRKEAFQQERLSEDDDPPFFLLTTRLDLVADVDALIADIRTHIGEEEIVLIVIDTLNRSIAGSESRDEDMGAYVKAADKVRETFKAAVTIIHHCGLEGTRPRGHTSLTGACDAQIAVKRDKDENSIVCTVEYMKDGPEGDQIGSQLKSVQIGEDEDGETLSSLVIEPKDVEPGAAVGKKLSPQDQIVLDVLRELVITIGEAPPRPGGGSSLGLSYDIPPNVRCVPHGTWRHECMRVLTTVSNTPDSKRSAFNRAEKKLFINGGFARICDDWVWLT